MKKFYALVVAVAVCLTTLTSYGQDLIEGLSLRRTAALTTSPVEKVISPDVNVPRKEAASRAASLTEDGTYFWAYYDLNSPDQHLEQKEVTVTIGADGKDATITGIADKALAASVNLEDGTISISKQYLTDNANGPVYFFFLEIQGNNVVASKTTTCTGKFTENGIEFDTTLVWVIGNENGQGGFSLAAYFNVFVDPELVPNELVYGTGVFTERIFSPLFNVYPAAYEVLVTYPEGNPDIIYIRDAAKGFFEAKHWSGDSGTWTLDISDRNNVGLGRASLGFGNGSNVTMYYVIGQSVLNSENGQSTNSEFMITCKEEGNKMTITFPKYSCYLISYPVQTSYASPEVSTLVITKEDESNGVANVAADANAPVEYFNLQGVKVENPANGVYIRRQGGATTKVLVK